MTTLKAIQKIEKATGEKVNVNANGQHYTSRISFYNQNGNVICIRVDGGSYYDNISQALGRVTK